MRGCQRLTVLVLVCAVILVFWALFQLLQGTMNVPVSTPSAPVVLHTPTSTATATTNTLPTETSVPASSPTAEPTATLAPTQVPSATPTSTPVPPTPTSTSVPTVTHTPRPSPTPSPQPTLPAEVVAYLDRFAPLVVSVEEEGILGNPAGIDQGTADRLRAVYRQLHEMTVPADAGETHLAFILYTSVLEEKCLCHVFADAHASDAQGQHYRECENGATHTASEVLSSRFVPARDAFLQQYSLTARQAGFPF